MQPTVATSIAPASRVTPTLGNISAQAVLKQQPASDRLRQGSSLVHYIYGIHVRCQRLDTKQAIYKVFLKFNMTK